MPGAWDDAVADAAAGVADAAGLAAASVVLVAAAAAAVLSDAAFEDTAGAEPELLALAPAPYCSVLAGAALVACD
jgi:hypothetical protein